MRFGFVFKGTVIQGTGFGANRVKIGILAVQGDFEAHAAMLAQLGRNGGGADYRSSRGLRRF